jgi:hypothetical protein
MIIPTISCDACALKDMRVEHYEFGRITIDGMEYTRDIIIFPDRVLPNWWRKEGHGLCLDDIPEVIQRRPKILILGNGYYGNLKVGDETQKALRRKGIDLRIYETRDAVAELNRLQSECADIVAALHLTC